MIAVLMAVFAFGQSYGILVNGHTYFAGTHVDDFGGYTQYLAHVQVAAGDYCQLYDATNEAAWAVDLDQATIDGFTRNNDRYEVSVSGCYDFYIKMKYGSDQLYIGAGSNCGDGEEIGGGESDQMYVWNGVGVTSADDAIELGGAAEAVQVDGTNIVVGASQKGNWCFKVNKGFAAALFSKYAYKPRGKININKTIIQFFMICPLFICWFIGHKKSEHNLGIFYHLIEFFGQKWDYWLKK